jgi:sulfate adenylyltransferase subunit 1 (EFTu-like GTPase family)
MSEKIQSNQKPVNKPLDFGSVDNIKGRGNEQENTVKVVESKEVINSIEPTLTKEDLFEKRNDVATKNISVNENKTTEKYNEDRRTNKGIEKDQPFNVILSTLPKSRGLLTGF